MTAEKLLEGCEHDGSFIPVREVKILMQKYACFKCLEAIKNTRHKAVDIIEEEAYYTDSITLQVNVQDVIRQIQNISNQDVMPEL